MTPEERQQLLIKASEQYVKGEIELEEYNKICRDNAVDYQAAFIAIAKASRSRPEG